MKLRTLGFLLFGLIASPAFSQDPCPALDVGPVVVDPPTFLSLGFSLPITSGDSDYDATVGVEYRQAGTSTWKNAQPLLRVRPQTVPDANVDEQFAGSIMNLQPDTSYEVRFHLLDPDGCDETIQVTTSTRPEPPALPSNPNPINVNSLQALNDAIAAAQPGDVITLANGTYVGTQGAEQTIRVDTKQGTFANPIVIQGESREGTIVDGNGATAVVRTVSSDYIHIQDLTLKNAKYGVTLVDDTTGTVVRRNIIREVTGSAGVGINMVADGTKRDLTICDNDLRGYVVFPEVTSATDYRGIRVAGQGGVVCYNTIAGFGDGLRFWGKDPSDPIRGYDFYGNDILWGKDDCMELDGTERNIRVFENRCLNTGQGVSAQPVNGGPAYVFHNIIYNIQNSNPKYVKLANQPSGVLLYHNLFGLRSLNASSSAYNIDFRNNLWVGAAQSNVIHFSSFSLYGLTSSDPATVDYNGYSYDGKFRFGNNLGETHNNLAALQAATPLEQNGRILTAPIFAANVPILPNANAEFVAPFDPGLHAASNAIDAGVVLPNINDGYAGSAPDLGPYELGTAVRQYGVRWNGTPPDSTPPSTPQNLVATAQSRSEIGLTWSESSDAETGVQRYDVYRDNAWVGNSTTTSFSDTDLADGTTYSYEVTAINGQGLPSPRSDPALATTFADADPPTILSVEAWGALTRVVVVFSEPVEQASATTASNYGVDGGITVSSASLGADLSTVTLTTSPLSSGITYTLTVNGVRDRATSPNTIAANTTATFQFIATNTVEIRIGASGDDVEEVGSTVDTTSTDMELVEDGGSSQTVGLRFQAVPLPSGATIKDAYVQFQVDEQTTSSSISLTVEGEAADDAAPFGPVASRTRTTASVPWIPAPWATVGEAGPDQRTPSLVPIIQEIVNRPGWASGNALVIVVSGSGRRTAEAFDGDVAAAPLLRVDYVGSGGASDPPDPPTGLIVD